MDVKEVARSLASAEPFRGLQTQDLEALAARGAVREAGEGDDLMREGDLGETMLLLLEGEAKIIKSDVNGRVRDIATVGGGTLLGEIALLESVLRTATVRATRPVRYFEMGREAFDDLLAQEDRAATRVALGIARTLARRQRQTNERLVALLVEVTQRGGPSADLDQFLQSLVIEIEV